MYFFFLLHHYHMIFVFFCLTYLTWCDHLLNFRQLRTSSRPEFSFALCRRLEVMCGKGPAPGGQEITFVFRGGSRQCECQARLRDWDAGPTGDETQGPLGSLIRCSGRGWSCQDHPEAALAGAGSGRRTGCRPSEVPCLVNRVVVVVQWLSRV